MIIYQVSTDKVQVKYQKVLGKHWGYAEENNGKVPRQYQESNWKITRKYLASTTKLPGNY